MARKTISWKTKGMNRDLSVSAFNPELAFENLNLRLSTNESNTLMSWVNERGPKEMTLIIQPGDYLSEVTEPQTQIIGTPLGTAVLNHKLVIFTHDASGHYGKENLIYLLQLSKDKENTLEGKILYAGNLGMTPEHPLETLVSYESETIQKVYWTDNSHQPRVINIAHSSSKRYNDGSFDFVQELALQEEVKIFKIFGSGEFPAGVIQYAFTYYNKYGQESNIFYTTPLQYISYVDRGGSAGSKIANSFKIHLSNIDQNFDYLRIYSILRTSKDSTPFCKRVQDIEITDTDITFIDTGLQGDTIDPTELLYLGGEEIIVETLEQKDGTLFLGNIRTNRLPLGIREDILRANGVTEASATYPLANDNVIPIKSERSFMRASKEPLAYVNTLSSPKNVNYYGASGFKAREYYRLGIQFQYKTGKWSEPYWIGDKQQSLFPSEVTVKDEDTGIVKETNVMAVPEFRYTLDKSIVNTLTGRGYKRARPLFAIPNLADRTVLCQGIGCPTVYRKIDRYANASQSKDASDLGLDLWEGSTEGKLYAQSSWLFRTPTSFLSDPSDKSSYANADATNGGGKVSYVGKLHSQYVSPYLAAGNKFADKESDYLKVMSPYLRDTEIMGLFDDGHVFYVDDHMATLHSPEFLFDTSFGNMDFNGFKLENVGNVDLASTYGDIDIQTSTPAIGSDAAGFVHRSIITDGGAALISAPFFNDYVVEGLDDNKYQAYNTKALPVDFPVYMWHKNGSLNNDVARGNRSAELLKKKISNYRLGKHTHYAVRDIYRYALEGDMQLFNDDTLSVTKVNGHSYMGNIETLITPTTPSPYFLIGSPWRTENTGNDYTDFNSDSRYFLALKNPYDTDSLAGIWSWRKGSRGWGFYTDTNAGDDAVYRTKGLAQWREPISMKYKSTPHVVVQLASSDSHMGFEIGTNSIYHSEEGEVPYDTFPVVEIVRTYNPSTLYGGTSTEALKAATWIPCGPPVSLKEDADALLNYKWGDTYFQRYECLKTYPFTQEDKNQVVEIASFMVETRVNIDGRYDRNRAQVSNLNMTPQNFNLMNPVYSQMDNFFSYKMLDKDDYRNLSYPNNVTWTKTKQNGADIDLWTNLTLANILELDGDKGTIHKLLRFNNQLLAFQDSGISQVLYNENTQISTTEGVPIEIANSEKVQGKRYLSNTIGCSNKWSMAQTPAGIYFMDSNEKSIYLFNGQLNNLSTAGGFNAWAKQHIPPADIGWTPLAFVSQSEASNFVTYYVKQNQDVLFINNVTALAYSEKFNCFTSFYSYEGSPFFVNLDDTGIWVKDNKVWEHQKGEYGNFFGENQPYSMTLVANQEPQMDKIFTNMEFRACVTGEGTYDESGEKFTPLLPFDTLEAWDEYQHGVLTLSNRNAGERLAHGLGDGILARKFRIWRCDIPRDNAPVNAVTEAPLGIKRLRPKNLDRIRNTWAYLKLSKNAVDKGASLNKTEIHDIMATYFA